MHFSPAIKAFSLFLVLLAGVAVFGQPPSNSRQPARTMTVPVSIFTKKELKEKQPEEYILAEGLTVNEDGDDQTILSIKSVSDTPLSIAIVIQADLSSGFNLQLEDLKQFIRDLPSDTRIMIAYARGGSPEIRQRFTEDKELATRAIRIVSGSAAEAPRSPYSALAELMSRFDATPTGRRAVLLFSDGLDTSTGLSLASVTQSVDLDQAILRAQRRGAAVYSFYHPTTFSSRASSILTLGSQGALEKLANETGGRAFIHGTGEPVSYRSDFKDITMSLDRQFALTFLSTHMKKGYHKLKITSSNPEIKIVHPKGYYYR